MRNKSIVCAIMCAVLCQHSQRAGGQGPSTKSDFSISTIGYSVSPADFPTVVRLCCGTTWTDMEPSQGSYNWSSLDSGLARTAAHSGSVNLLTLLKVPSWAGGSSSNNNPPFDVINYAPTDSRFDQSFHNFVTALMQHLCNVTSRPNNPIVSGCSNMRYIEMWNEFNTDQYWMNGTDQQLAEMSDDASKVIHAYCGDCYVVAGSTSAGGDGWHTNGQPGNYMTALEDYLQRWGAIPGASLPDAISFHAYPSRTDVTPAPFPTTIVSHGSSYCSTTTPNVYCRAAIKDQVNDVKGTAVLKNAAISSWAGSLPVLITEGGYGLNTNVCDNGNCDPSSDQHVATLREAYAAEWEMLLAAQGAEHVLWYAYNEPNWGTMYGGTSTNSTYTAFVQMSGWLQSMTITSQPIESAVSGGNVWIVQGTINGAKAELIFFDGWLSSYNYATSYGTVQTLDGATGPTNGVATITQEPQLLTDYK